MITGIESAGLALGLFPLVIEGVKFYISSADTCREIMRHKRTLHDFRRELVVEKTISDNRWYILMSRAGVHFDLNIEPSPDIVERVLSCLPTPTAWAFVDRCQELNKILSSLAEKFQKYEQDTEGMDYILARLCLELPVNKAGYRKMVTMLKHFKKTDCEQCLERINRLNSNLGRLVNGAPQIAAVEASQFQKDAVGHYQRVRKQAIILYGALKERLQISSCTCEVCTVHLLYHNTLNHFLC